MREEWWRVTYFSNSSLGTSSANCYGFSKRLPHRFLSGKWKPKGCWLYFFGGFTCLLTCFQIFFLLQSHCLWWWTRTTRNTSSVSWECKSWRFVFVNLSLTSDALNSVLCLHHRDCCLHLIQPVAFITIIVIIRESIIEWRPDSWSVTREDWKKELTPKTRKNNNFSRRFSHFLPSIMTLTVAWVSSQSLKMRLQEVVGQKQISLY